MIAPTILTWVSFGTLATITVGAAAGAVTLRNLFHAVLALILSLLGVAGLFLMLAAEFIAAIHVLIYVGAIATLFIFVVMLTVRLDDATQRQSNRQVFPALITCAALLAVLLATLLTAPWPQPAEVAEPPSVQTLGHEMLTTHILPFEVVSLLLLVALVGSVTLARKEPES